MYIVSRHVTSEDGDVNAHRDNMQISENWGFGCLSRFKRFAASKWRTNDNLHFHAMDVRCMFRDGDRGCDFVASPVDISDYYWPGMPSLR